MSLLDRFIDQTPALRCSRAEAVGHVTSKAFVKDAGFGDCPMQIVYEFHDTSGKTVIGRYVSTESSFCDIQIGAQILIRYLEANSGKNAPTDSLGIIKPISNNG